MLKLGARGKKAKGIRKGNSGRKKQELCGRKQGKVNSNCPWLTNVSIVFHMAVYICTPGSKAVSNGVPWPGLHDVL